MSVLYLHGFASSPGSEKVRKVRELLPDIELITPDLNVPSFEKLDFEAIVQHAMEISQPDAVVGSSLGGLIALEVVRRGIRKPLVLIAPAIGVSDQWLARIPAGDPISVFHYGRNANAPIHRAFFEQMSRIHAEDTKPGVPVTLIMGKKDESIPFDRVAGVWRRWQADGPLPPGSRFVQIAEGDHGLTAFVDILAREIRAAVSPRSDILST